tara:strand:+ start:29 stop:562 length:534 start_codon:yes stop_codon:yes gene_type:complete
MNKKLFKINPFYLFLFAMIMLLTSYASVPLYKLFCQVTGYGGTPMKVDNVMGQVVESELKVRFDSSIEKNSNLFFEPVSNRIKTKLGEKNLIFYKAKNLSNKPVLATATFNVTPLNAAQYFNKIECFCFEEQAFAPGQEVEMPVSFFIDSDILNDEYMKSVDELTLSYTMYIKKETE